MEIANKVKNAGGHQMISIPMKTFGFYVPLSWSNVLVMRRKFRSSRCGTTGSVVSLQCQDAGSPSPVKGSGVVRAEAWI